MGLVEGEHYKIQDWKCKCGSNRFGGLFFDICMECGKKPRMETGHNSIYTL